VILALLEHAMVKQNWLTEKLLQDRELAKQREVARQAERRATRQTADFDPFDVTLRLPVAGPDPGYLPKTPMRMGKVGWHVACKTCGQEFESKGRAYCPTCMEIPAEERRAVKPVAQGRLCQGPGCENFISRTARANQRFCSRACAKRALYSSRRDEPDPNSLQP